MNDQILPGPFEISRILEFLPHRYPFLLIDRVLSLEMEPQKRLTGLKNVTMNEPYFQGHFPANPVMPGVLVIEAMAQAAGMLAHLAAETRGEEGEVYYLVKVDNGKFNKVIVPGDQVILDVIQKRVMRNMGQYECKAFVDEQRVASCELLCAGRKA
jgi:3-hydroxyacyl-[acyl-carrier-protein] dehydratase